MIFKTYDKIEEDFKRYNLSEEANRLLNKIEWVVTEKIHGANFSILTNGNFIKYAKRKEVLEDDDEFFGYQQVLREQELNFMRLFEHVKTDFPEVRQIAVYGELFGGGYPSPEITSDPTVSLIQTGIYYSPHIEFAVFDILVFKANEQEEFVNYSRLLTYCQNHHILCCQPLYIGKLSGALNFNFEFESTIPRQLHLPKLDIPNKAEGVVIKPVDNIFIDTPKGKVRPIIKRKIVEFSEELYSQSFQDSDIRQRLLGMVNKNRLNSAISKVGSVRKGEKDKLKKVHQYMMEDIQEELRNLESTRKKLNAKQKEIILKEAEDAIHQLLLRFSG